MANGRSGNSGCLLAFLDLFGGGARGETETLPYRTRDDFLSAAELSFRHVLASVVKDQVVICPKVRLGDIFFVGRGEGKLSYTNRIASKHVDFLLCDPKTLKPLAGVELDDSSHDRADRKERDEFVDRVFKAAGLPLEHVTAQRNYSPQAIADLILPVLNKQPGSPAVTPAPAQPPATESAPAAKGAPICPKCGVPMVLRTAKSGANTGKSFYGCTNYPRCREMVSTA